MGRRVLLTADKGLFLVVLSLCLSKPLRTLLTGLQGLLLVFLCLPLPLPLRTLLLHLPLPRPDPDFPTDPLDTLKPSPPLLRPFDPSETLYPSVRTPATGPTPL